MPPFSLIKLRRVKTGEVRLSNNIMFAENFVLEDNCGSVGIRLLMCIDYELILKFAYNKKLCISNAE